MPILDRTWVPRSMGLEGITCRTRRRKQRGDVSALAEQTAGSPRRAPEP
jgi:hypothetical protein